MGSWIKAEIKDNPGRYLFGPKGAISHGMQLALIIIILRGYLNEATKKTFSGKNHGNSKRNAILSRPKQMHHSRLR